jgi:hypothetical protein
MRYNFLLQKDRRKIKWAKLIEIVSNAEAFLVDSDNKVEAIALE